MKQVDRILSRSPRFVPGLAAAALAGACGTEPLIPGSIAVSPPSATLPWLADTVQLTATVRDTAGRTMRGFTVVWTSEDESVATVDAGGLVTAVAKGQTYVWARAGLVGKSAPVTVAPDRRALLSFYEALAGSRWLNSRNWGTDAPLYQWHGVEADFEDNVLALELVLNRLSGTIPPEIGALGALEELNLNRNILRGSIPPELGNLRSLRTMNLRRNALTGPVPPELGSLDGLDSLDLSSNEITGAIPPELGDLRNLRALYLYNNKLAGPIPPELGILEELGTLSLSSNELSGQIPPELGNLRNLRALYLYNNKLAGPVPPELGNLRNLQVLNLSSNRFLDSIPYELGDLRNLWFLYLDDNFLTGSVPPELGDLHDLRHLVIDRNPLSGRLPRKLIGLRLWLFHWDETDLCSPPDAEFQEWLASIGNHRGNGPCDS